MENEHYTYSDLTRMAKQNFPGLMAAVESNKPTLAPNPFAISMLEYINKNHGFMKAMFGPKGNLTFQSRIKDFLWKTIFKERPNSIIREEDLFSILYCICPYQGDLVVVRKWQERVSSRHGSYTIDHYSKMIPSLQLV